MEENNIRLTDDVLEFIGFDLIKDKLTFCLYSGGIAIVPGWETAKLPCHYESKLENDSKIRDISLIKKLKERGFGKENDFIQIKNHYIELNPHKNP